jgi:hypothetical protein
MICGTIYEMICEIYEENEIYGMICEIYVDEEILYMPY